jgi:hypothetical protein
VHQRMRLLVDWAVTTSAAACQLEKLGLLPRHGPRCWLPAHYTGRRSRMPGRSVHGAETRAPSTTRTFALGTDSRYALAAAASSFRLGASFAFALGTASGYTLAATSGFRLGVIFTFAFDPVGSLRSRPSPCDSPLTSEDRWAFGTFGVIENTEKGSLQWTALSWLMRSKAH